MGRLTIVFLISLLCSMLGTAKSTMPILEPAAVTDMQQTIFPSGGLLEIKDSLGDVEIVGWDSPEIEVVVTKSTHKRYSPEEMEKVAAELDRIVIATEQVANDHFLIRTEFPSRNHSRLARVKGNVHLAYRIHVPRQTRLVVHQESGGLKIHDVTASMQLSNRTGDIEVNLPDNERYAIDARVRVGGVTSDWCSESEPSDDGVEPHQLLLRVGVGDITVRKFPVVTDTLVDD